MYQKSHVLNGDTHLRHMENATERSVRCGLMPNYFDRRETVATQNTVIQAEIYGAIEYIMRCEYAENELQRQ